jgi:metal transporter CNNM
MAIVSSQRRQRDADGDDEDDRDSSTDATAVSDAHEGHSWRRARKHLGAIDEEKQLGGDAASSGSGSHSDTASLHRGDDEDLAEEKASSKRSWMRRLVRGSEPAARPRRMASRPSAAEEQHALEAVADAPIGIITLEDLLEELLAEEIYDEHDKEGAGSGLRDFSPPASPSRQATAASEVTPAEASEKVALAANDALAGEARTPPLRSLTFPSEVVSTAPGRLSAALALSAPRRISQRRRAAVSDTEREAASDGDDEDTADDSDAPAAQDLAQSSELPPRASGPEKARRASSAEPGPRTLAAAAPAARQRRSQRGRSLLRRATAGAASAAGEESPAPGVARSSSAANLSPLPVVASPASGTSTPIPAAARGARFKSTPLVAPKQEQKLGSVAGAEPSAGASAQPPPGGT